MAMHSTAILQQSLLQKSPEQKPGCWTRFTSACSRFGNVFWGRQLKSSDEALRDQNCMGYVTETINCIFPICDVMNTIADASGLSRLTSSVFAFAREPVFGLTWGGTILSLIPVWWLAKVDVECHQAQSLCI